MVDNNDVFSQYQTNMAFNRQSDIFNTKSLEKPVFHFQHKGLYNKNNNRSSMDLFVSKDDNNQQTNHRSSNDNILTARKKNITFRPKDTLKLGDYKGEEYIVKKEKNKNYNPDKYFVKDSAIERGIKQNYLDHIEMGGLNSDTKRQLWNNAKSKNIQVNRKKNNEKNYNEVTAKFRIKKYRNNSSGYRYEPQNCKQNRINMLKSNIFNNDDKEILNNKKKTNTRLRSVENFYEDKIIDFPKKSLFEKDKDKFPTKTDWKDEKTALLFPIQKDEVIENIPADQRKFNEIYGNDAKKNEIQNIKNDRRDQIEKKMFDEDDIIIKHYNNDKNKIQKASDNISQIQGKEFIEQTDKYTTNINNDSNNNNVYEIKCGKNKNNITMKDISTIFAENGVHIYDCEEGKGGFLQNKPEGKFSFKIREDTKDENFKQKVEDIKNYLKKSKGVEINLKNNEIKKKADDVPTSVKWSDPNLDKWTKNKNFEKTKNEKTAKNKNGEKITKVFINTKYKNFNKYNLSKK